MLGFLEGAAAPPVAQRSGDATITKLPPRFPPFSTFTWVELDDARPRGLENCDVHYREAIADVDRWVGALLQWIPEDAILVVVGDRGASLGEHGQGCAAGPRPFAADTRVPLLIRAPELRGRVVRDPVSTVGVTPTILEVLNLDIPTEVQAPSLLYAPLSVVLSRDRDLQEVFRRASRWTLSGQEAFDRQEDPRELHPVPPSRVPLGLFELEKTDPRGGGSR